MAARLESVPEEMGSSQPPNVRADVVADWKEKMDMVRRELAAFDLEEGKKPRQTSRKPGEKRRKYSGRAAGSSRQSKKPQPSNGVEIIL